MWLERLRNFNEDKAGIHDMIELAWIGKSLRAEFEQRAVTVPEFLDDALRRLNRAIEAHRRDALELRLKKAQQESASLRTAAERRADLAAEIQKLETELAAAK